MQTAADHLNSRVQSLENKLNDQIAGMPADELASLKEANVRTLKMDEAKFTHTDLNRERPSPKP